MNFCPALQTQLQQRSSTIVLSKTMDGTYHESCAWPVGSADQPHFRAYSGTVNSPFYFSLLEPRALHQGDFCTYKGLVTSLEELAIVLDAWVNKREVEKLTLSSLELVKFEPFPASGIAPALEVNWNSIKNRWFEWNNFKHPTGWDQRYAALLLEARKRPLFQQFSPYNSHYLLNFHKTTEKWSHNAFATQSNILPLSEEDLDKGSFYVYIEEEDTTHYFDTVIAAFDYYVAYLLNLHPEYRSL